MYLILGGFRRHMEVQFLLMLMPNVTRCRPGPRTGRPPRTLRATALPLTELPVAVLFKAPRKDPLQPVHAYMVSDAALCRPPSPKEDG